MYQCKGKYSRRDNILRAYKVKRYDKSKYTKDELIDIINENINAEKKHPIALSYKIKNLLTPEKKNGNHNSIIYGKACKNHKIYYLIRNSWGGPSLKDMTEKRVFLYKKYSGDFWISGETLKKTWTKNYGAIYIIKKKNYS